MGCFDMKSADRRRYFLFSGGFLTAGGLVYLLFRNARLLIFDWFQDLEHLNGLYLNLDTKNSATLSVLVFNLPDGLWLVSGILAIRGIWAGDRKMGNVYGLIFVITAVLLELLQLFPEIPGTFDPLDIITMVSAAFVEGAVYKNRSLNGYGLKSGDFWNW
jgi:Na+-translocating ferredoxin:NAD+ oxidoreductase RnfA subunit